MFGLSRPRNAGSRVWGTSIYRGRGQGEELLPLATLVIRVEAHANSPATRLLGAAGAGARSLKCDISM